jgi:hypothetical protein
MTRLNQTGEHSPPPWCALAISPKLPSMSSARATVPSGNLL